MNRAFTFWYIGLHLGLVFSGCVTPEPEDHMAQTCELASYVTAKREILLYPTPGGPLVQHPGRRTDFQLTVDVLEQLLSGEIPKPVAEKQLAAALSWCKVPELRCTTGAVIIGKDSVRFEGTNKKARKIRAEDFMLVAFEINMGIKRFLEIQ